MDPGKLGRALLDADVLLFTSMLPVALIQAVLKAAPRGAKTVGASRGRRGHAGLGCRSAALQR